jgi:uncharacterized membrane protein
MSRVVALAVAMAVVAAAAPARAQDHRAEAEQLFRAGEKLYKRGVYDEAAGLFEQAYGLLPLPAIAFSAAQAYRLQYFADDDARKLKRAIELYEKYIADTPSGGRKADAVQSLAELKPRMDLLEASKGGPIGSMAAPVAQTKLMVSSQVDGAMVTVDDGAPVEQPLVREVEPGRYRIRVTADGYAPFDEKRDVVDGQFRSVEVVLVALKARLTVHAAAGAALSVDGRPVGVAPLATPVLLDAGKHLVTATRRGHQPWSREIELERGEQLDLTAEQGITTQRRVAYGVFAAAGVSLTVGGVVAVLAASAGSQASELNDKRLSQGITSDELVRYDSLVARRDSRRTASLVLVGVGGGLAVAGALLYLLDQPRADSSAAAERGQALLLSPVVDGDLAGLAVTGRF